LLNFKVFVMITIARCGILQRHARAKRLRQENLSLFVT